MMMEQKEHDSHQKCYDSDTWTAELWRPLIPYVLGDVSIEDVAD